MGPLELIVKSAKEYLAEAPQKQRDPTNQAAFRAVNEAFDLGVDEGSLFAELLEAWPSGKWPSYSKNFRDLSDLLQQLTVDAVIRQIQAAEVSSSDK